MSTCAEASTTNGCRLNAKAHESPSLLTSFYRYVPAYARRAALLLSATHPDDQLSLLVWSLSAIMLATEAASSSLIQGPTRTYRIAHLLNASSNHTLETSDLRYFTVVDVAQHEEWAPRPGSKLLFIARRSVRGAPGALPILRSLSTWALALPRDSGAHDQLEMLSTRPIVADYALASNLDVMLTTDASGRSVLYGIGGHHLAWDVRKKFSKLGRHDVTGFRMRPRDGLHLLRASRLADVLSGAWLPWSQFVAEGSFARSKGQTIVDETEAAASRARKASVIIDGSHPGCVERFNRYAPLCYFDSKMSLTRFRGRYLVFARANTVDRGGGRFVQVAETAGSDPAGPYGPFEMLKIDGYTNLRSGNIYTAVVHEHPLEPTMLLGLFSVNEGVPHRVNGDGRCYIAVALSCDGKRWSRLTPLLQTAGMKGRTYDQPVSGLVRRGSSVHFFVHRDVSQISPAAPTSSRLERYTFRTAKLSKLASDVKASLRCGT